MADWQIEPKIILKWNDSSLKGEIGTGRQALKVCSSVTFSCSFSISISPPPLPHPAPPLQIVAPVTICPLKWSGIPSDVLQTCSDDRPNEQKWGAKMSQPELNAAWLDNEVGEVSCSALRPLDLFLAISLSLSCILDNKWHDSLPAYFAIRIMADFLWASARRTGWLMDGLRRGRDARVVMHCHICLPGKWCMP